MSTYGIDLYWLPLGAGGHCVRLNGKVFEAVAATIAGRDHCDLYHSALQVYVPEGRYVIEQAPAAEDGRERGVVSEGSVGSRAASRFRRFRYEVRSWRDGIIPDIDEAVDSPRRLSNDVDVARRLLALVPEVPTPTWGRDELHAGEMWNSNSVVSWLLTRSGLPVESIQPPEGGRAPGWQAGIVVANRLPAHFPAACGLPERRSLRPAAAVGEIPRGEHPQHPAHQIRVSPDVARRTRRQQAFVKPSAGLEPATPSLPWRCSTN